MLGSLHAEHFPALVGLAGLLLRDRGAAEDVVQEGFADVYRAWHRIREPDRVLSYVRSAVLNRARNRLRRRRLAARMVPWVATADGSPEDGALSGDRRARLLAALDALPRRQREVVVLRFYAELSERETGEALGISVGSVKTHLHRALRALAEQVEDDR